MKRLALVLLCLTAAGCLGPPELAEGTDAGCTDDCVACCLAQHQADDGGAYAGVDYECEMECEPDGGGR